MLESFLQGVLVGFMIAGMIAIAYSFGKEDARKEKL